MACLSLGLLGAGYLALAWGSLIVSFYGFGLVAFGAVMYFASLEFALRSGLLWLRATVITAGALIGVGVLVVCASSFSYGKRESPVLITLVLAGISTAFYFLRKLKSTPKDG